MAGKPKQIGSRGGPKVGGGARGGSRGAAMPAGAVARVVKGGDGGAAVPEAMLHGGSFAHDRDNLRVVLVCVGGGNGQGGMGNGKEARRREADGLVATADPFDVAHNQRDGSGVMYLPQGDVRGRGEGAPRRGLMGCPRRRYPASQIVSSGVAIDSMFDGLAARVARLEGEGLAPGRVSAIAGATAAEMLDARLPRGLRLRDVLHARTRCAMDDDELRLERAASRMLGRFTTESTGGTEVKHG